MNKKAKIFILFVFAALVTYFILNPGEINLTAEASSVKTIDISGTIEYKKTNLSFKTAGKVAELNFDEGLLVKKGDLLSKYDVTDLMIQRKKAETALGYSESMLSQLETIKMFQAANYESQILLAKANVAAAVARLTEALAGNREQQIDQAKAALTKAEIEAEKLQKDYKRYSELIKTGAITPQTFDNIKSQYMAAEQLLNSARNQYDLLREGTRKETIELMRAGVAQAEAQLKGAEALSYQVKKAECDVESMKKDIEVKKADIEVINNKISDSYLYAPEDGTILEKFTETSEVVGAASPVGILANMKDVWVRGYIPEQDLGRIKIGQKVDILSDSYPDKVYKGYVAYISPEAEFTPKNVQTKRERVKLVYRVKVNVDNANGELKLGMPVDAKIIVQ
ncbi:MAG: efflux RND transporter periplasmic adaptor subunit [Candidatus Wallbacteria bacterium]